MIFSSSFCIVVVVNNFLNELLLRHRNITALRFNGRHSPCVGRLSTVIIIPERIAALSVTFVLARRIRIVVRASSAHSFFASTCSAPRLSPLAALLLLIILIFRTRKRRTTPVAPYLTHVSTFAPSPTQTQQDEKSNNADDSNLPDFEWHIVVIASRSNRSRRGRASGWSKRG